MKISNYLIMGWAFLLLTACNSPSVNKVKEATKTDAASSLDSKTENATAKSAVTASNPEQNQLIGDWVRNDGGYILRISNTTSNGKLEAGYFNPNPIHVGRGEWIIKERNLFIYVELQDVNYPGSAYTLKFLPGENKLSGNYFQAVEGVNYDVEFVRAPQNNKP